MINKNGFKSPKNFFAKIKYWIDSYTATRHFNRWHIQITERKAPFCICTILADEYLPGAFVILFNRGKKNTTLETALFTVRSGDQWKEKHRPKTELSLYKRSRIQLEFFLLLYLHSRVWIAWIPITVLPPTVLQTVKWIECVSYKVIFCFLDTDRNFIQVFSGENSISNELYTINGMPIANQLIVNFLIEVLYYQLYGSGQLLFLFITTWRVLWKWNRFLTQKRNARVPFLCFSKCRINCGRWIFQFYTQRFVASREN